MTEFQMVETEDIQLLNYSDPIWEEYSTAHRSANIFHSPAWMEIMEASYGYRPLILAVKNPEGRLSAALPFMEVNSPFTGRRWVALPFSDHCEPLYQDQLSLNQLGEAIVSLYNAKQFPRLELRGWFPSHPIFQPHSEYAFHKIALEADLGNVTDRIHPMHMRNIKIAQKNDIQVVWGNSRNDLREFYQLHLYTRHKQGVPVQPWSFFEKLWELIVDRGLGFILLAYKDQDCLAGAIFLHWNECITYKYGASHMDYLKYRPNNLLMWSAIQWGCENGYTQLDLGRSSLSNVGLRTYKNRWGAQESSLWYARVPPGASPSNYKRWLGAVQFIIPRSPLWVCRLIGELFYKYFG